MTATLAASAAILKTRYPKGKLPKALYKRTKYTSTITKREDFTGDKRVIALQNENPQGSSSDMATAIGSLAQGSYKRFEVPRVEHFGVCRIKGQALRAAEGDEGALVDLWKNETDGISQVEMLNIEIYSFGNGSGVLGKLNGGVVSGATVTLLVPEDAAKFSLNMRVQAVSTNSLSPTLRGGYAVITGIDRKLGVLTVASTWTDFIPSLGVSDYLVRAGDYASAGTGRVLMGKQGWVVDSATPGTLYGLDRNADPIRLAGQVYDATGVPMEEAFIEASALVNQQGAPQPTRAWAHPRDIANFKKALGAKVTYPRTSVESTEAGISFSAIKIEGDEGEISIMTSPFVDRYKCHLDDPDAWILDSIGPAPMLLDLDSNEFLRVQGDDAYEARFGFYGNHECNAPYGQIMLKGFGATA